MGLTNYERLAYRFFGTATQRRTAQNQRLQLTLQRAHIHKRPDAYLAAAYLTAMIVVGVGVLLILLLAISSAAGIAAIPGTLFLYVTPLPLVLGGAVYALNLLMPDIRAMGRSRDIDAKLPYAINYIATMASAGATPGVIFRSLGEQDIYGEVANEASWISRDMDLLGMDILTALDAAMTRSPSVRFQDFLQGAITTLSTGGDLESYFIGKSEQFMLDNRQMQDKFLDGLGVLAEAFVVVVVAAPLFLLVMLSVMGSFGGNAGQLLNIGYVMVLALLPLAQFGFAMTVLVSTPEG